jgi:hypothetical protein
LPRATTSAANWDRGVRVGGRSCRFEGFENMADVVGMDDVEHCCEQELRRMPARHHV